MSRKRRKHPGSPQPAPAERTPAASPATGAAPSPRAPVRATPGALVADPDAGEPVSEHRLVPAWMFGLLALLIYTGNVYVWNYGGDVMGKTGWFSSNLYDPFTSHSELVAANPKTEGDLRGKGQLVYERNCQQCHQATGLGVAGQFPPLAGSEWVLADGPGRMARIVLNGFAGPVTVKGVQYNNNMFAFRDLLSDADIAAVLTFIRTEWGNAGSPIKPEQVKKIREATADRSTQWNEAELLKIPVTD
jgi:mono/diheme cytochrome c family protein